MRYLFVLQSGSALWTTTKSKENEKPRETESDSVSYQQRDLGVFEEIVNKKENAQSLQQDLVIKNKLEELKNKLLEQRMTTSSLCDNPFLLRPSVSRRCSKPIQLALVSLSHFSPHSPWRPDTK